MRNKITTVNNDIYNGLANSWWDENGVLHLLKVMVNPWRVPYFQDKLIDHFGNDRDNIRLLDIGCGGGVLSEEFAHMGYAVTGIDTSTASIKIALDHARTESLSIMYQAGSATEIPFDASSFEVVSCCDVLEHIPDWLKVISEVRRILKPGGLFLFDTINRTLESRINFIFGLQDFPLTRLFPKNTHIWEMFIKPDELRASLEENGLFVKGLQGGTLGANPIKALQVLIQYKQGKISVADLGNALKLHLDSNLSLNYLGFAQKR